MSIPLLRDDGNLPSGIWPCTVEEIEARFGQTRRRRELLRLFRQFRAELRRRDIHGTILIDGSFVTTKPAPKDMDILVVLSIPIYEQHKTEIGSLRKRWCPALDIFFVAEGTPARRDMARLFGEDRLYRSRGLLEIGGES